MKQQLPTWLSPGVEPPESLKTNGWQPGMKPAAQHMNWLFNRIYECLNELQTNTNIVEVERRLTDIETLIGPFETIATTEIANITAAISALRTQLTTHLADYATTKDMTINVTSSESLHEVLNRLPKRIDHIVTINVAGGVYEEDVYFEGRVGKGHLLINGDSVVSGTRKVRQLLLINNTIRVTVVGLEFTTITGSGLYSENCSDVIADKCRCVVSSPNQNAITFVFSRGTVQFSELSNRAMGIYAGNSSIVTSSGNTGSGNQLGLVAEFTSTLGKAGTQPGGATAELKSYGGEIR